MGVGSQQKSCSVRGEQPRSGGSAIPSTSGDAAQPLGAAPGTGAPRHGHAGGRADPGSPGAGRTGPAVPPPPAPPRGWAVPPGRERPLPGPRRRCRRKLAHPPAPHLPLTCPSPARRSREALPQRSLHTNFPRQTLGPGGLGRGPSGLGQTLPAPASGSPWDR